MQSQPNTEEEHQSLSPSAGATSSTAGPLRLWQRFAIPSSADVIFVALLVGLGTGRLSNSLLGDGGTGWHIRTGDWILKTHTVPRVDLFSTTMQGKPWYAWEWLYDVLVGLLHTWAGLNAVVLFTAFVIALTFVIMLRSVTARGANLPIAVILLLFAFCASTVHFLARPHVLSWLFTLVWLESLEAFEVGGKARVLLGLPLLMVVWVNVHGGFLVGLILLAIYLVSDVVSAARGASNVERASSAGRARVLALVGIAAGVATLCNPYSYNLYIHIQQYLGDPFLMHHIDEFLAPNFHSVAQRCFAALVVVAVATMVVSSQRLPLRHLLLLLFAMASGFYAVRNIPLSSMLIVLFAAPMLSALFHDYAKNRKPTSLARILARVETFGTRMMRFDGMLCGHLWPLVACVGLLAICLVGGTVGGRSLMDAHFDQKRFPVQASDFLSAHYDSQPVFTLDRWGGYLIYRFYPELVVAVDDRHDLYGSTFLKQYLNIVRADSGWDSALESLHPAWVMVPAESPLAGPLRQSGQWKSIYRDETAELFRKEAR